MAKSPQIPHFEYSADDPYAAEHADIAKWSKDAVAKLKPLQPSDDIDLKSLPSGRKLLDAKPDQAKRYVLAAIQHARHWEALRAQMMHGATREQRVRLHKIPGFDNVIRYKSQAVSVMHAMMRRALPWDREELLTILQWCNSSKFVWNGMVPIRPVARAIDRYATTTPIDDKLRAAIKRFSSNLVASDKRQLGHSLQKHFRAAADKPPAGKKPKKQRPLAAEPKPAVAGSPYVFGTLKRRLGMLPPDDTTAYTAIGPDRFRLDPDSPFQREHKLLTTLYEAANQAKPYRDGHHRRHPAGRALLALKPASQCKALVAAAERYVGTLLFSTVDEPPYFWGSSEITQGAIKLLRDGRSRLQRDELFDFLLYLSMVPADEVAAHCTPEVLIEQVEREAAKAPFTEGERFVLSLFRKAIVSGPYLGKPGADVARLTELINDGAAFFLVPGEVWSDTVNRELGRLSTAQQEAWAALLGHALTATSARPSAKWLEKAGKLVDAVGGDAVREALLRWLPLVAQGQSVRKVPHDSGDLRGAADVMEPDNAVCLRGLLWMAPKLPQPEELVRPIFAAALSAYKKVPGVGPRGVKAGNAAVYALSEMGTTLAVGQLAMLKVRVKSGSAQKEIEKAYDTAAKALELPRDQIEELGIPVYGLEEVGLRRETLGDYRAELSVTGSAAELRWCDAAGKELKSVPAKVKEGLADELKELQQSLKDIRAMLPAQRDRIDGMFLQQKTWPIETWRERYLDHPLLGTIARRMLWCVDGEPALFRDGKPTDVKGKSIRHGKTAEITLWHPVGQSVKEITAWRQRLADLEITQPFKQAHREIYLLTDAERKTRTYSNRFASHILRQHQFHALCAARGWKDRLRLLVGDDSPPATKELPQWGLRAEFWVEGLGEDTNESGVFVRLSTDQVRFYRIEEESNAAQTKGRSRRAVSGNDGQNPIRLDEVPPLVFSEIMRDVDLFVGVASVGSDPRWQDGGPDGQYRDYWQSYSFGELSATAATRRDVLKSLVPRLKIAKRCSFQDRFLVVRGDRRTYKIHLGSGNVLMEPDDQYLCIVPDSSAAGRQEDLYLPFEGDHTLSIIVSKALLLAEDAKIKDATITRQIAGE